MRLLHNYSRNLLPLSLLLSQLKSICLLLRRRTRRRPFRRNLLDRRPLLRPSIRFRLKCLRPCNRSDRVPLRRGEKVSLRREISKVKARQWERQPRVARSKVRSAQSRARTSSLNLLSNFRTVEDFAANGGATTPKGQLSVLPDSTLSASPRPLTANNSAKPSASPLPEPTSEPPRRKRQKIEYVPMSKPQDAVAGYDLAGTEEVLQRTARRKRPRTAHDLGSFFLPSLAGSACD